MTETYLVTGGTGSFGQVVVHHILEASDAFVRVFSRDEAKQDLMRSNIQSERVKYFLGDVRDEGSIRKAMAEVDYVFHAAALKQVPSAEFFPDEFVKTNIIGTQNLINAAIDAGVRKVVCLSTDKAVYPINAMGISKAMMEKVALSHARSHLRIETQISVTRYGNVLMSRGSVVPRFIEQIRKGQPITLTNPSMTRFIMRLSESVELVMKALSSDTTGDIFVKKSNSASLLDLSHALISVLGAPEDYPIHTIGTRHGEKLYESLLSSEELGVSEDLGEYFRIPLDERDLNYERYFDIGEPNFKFTDGYHSHNSSRLTKSDLQETLSSLIEDYLG